jgi:hypothetical protein
VKRRGLKVEVREFGKPGGLQLLPTPPGTCEACAVKHDPAHPHNAQSLYYQYWFYAKEQRWPTWNDAMAHCDDAMKEFWRQELMARNVDVDGGGINPRGPGERLTAPMPKEVAS